MSDRFRDEAVRRVDARYGFTVEQAPDAAAHRLWYDEEEYHIGVLARCRKIAEDATPLFKSLWGSMYPTGYCGIASLCLVTMLRASTDANYKIALGTAGANNHAHVWIETDDMDIIDVTYGQFLSPEAAINPVRVLHYDDRRNLMHFAHRYLMTDEEDTARWTTNYSGTHDGIVSAGSNMIKTMLGRVMEHERLQKQGSRSDSSAAPR